MNTKKITLIAALLGSAYFTNAQVGIGTPSPHVASILEIDSKDKGVLIPRVDLTSLTDYLPIQGPEVNGLLVYATGKDSGSPSEGFYYWNVDKWERIINQTDLDTAVGNQVTDLTKIKNLLNAAYGSNNLGNSPTNIDFGGMVFTAADGSTPASISYVKWNTTDNAYEKVDITSIISDLVSDTQSETLLYSTTNKKKQYYISETYFANVTNPAITQAIVDGWTDPLPTGVYLIDVVNGVVNNFSDIINSNTTIDGTSTTIKEYFEALGATDANSVYFNNSSLAITVGGTSVPAFNFYLKNQTGDAVLIDLAEIVKDLETDTQITKNATGTAANGDVNITYKYFNEAQPLTTGTPQQTIDLNADLKTLIEGNTEIKNAILNVLNAGGNVYFTETIIAAGTPSGQLEIPANSFYTIDVSTGLKKEIVVPVSIDQLITAINNSSVSKKNELKLALGDKLTTINTSVFTGDTIKIDNVDYYIYKGNFSTVVTANTAITTGVTLDKAAAKILSIDLRYSNGLSANVTDLILNSTALGFNIGTGKMYQVLSSSATNAEVVIEFASSVNPVTP